jgi:hypothetical protein
MCNFFSCIVTRDLKVHYSKKTCSHEEIIAELKLCDTKLIDRDFVRIEITPKNKENPTRNPADWHFKVDEESTVPSWYSKAKKQVEENIWLSWSESIKTQLVLEGESTDQTDTYLFAVKASTVVARGSSKVEAWGSSTVVAWDSSTVVARGSSKVVARGSSTVEAWDSSTVVAWDSSKVELLSESAVALCHNKIIVNKKATVIISESFTATEIKY